VTYDDNRYDDGYDPAAPGPGQHGYDGGDSAESFDEPWRDASVPAPFPWPPAEGESIPAAYGRTWYGASLQPQRFFAAMPAAGSVGHALLYYLPIGIVVAGTNLFWTMARGGVAPEEEAVLGEMPIGGAMSPLLEFLFSPLILLISIFMAAGVTHLLLRLVGGANRDFGFTTRVFAFAYSPQLLGIVPVVGAVVGFIWMVVVAVMGLREGHRTTLFRAAVAVLIPVAIGLALVAVAAFVASTGNILLH
jgi:hypothetical protein